jgi:hypothetical protein
MIRCLNCGGTFDSLEAYQSHQWRDHGGEPDEGEVFA